MPFVSPPKISTPPVVILLVEDDDDDVLLISKTFKTDVVRSQLFRVEDGVQAIEFLRRQGQFADAPRPDLILLDLNMPRKDGREVLKEIKEDVDLRLIPVVVLTTSESESDILASYNYHANSFISKPLDLVEFRQVLAAIREYWFSIVKLPRS
ncbi:response regulator [Aureliella helgolandensis]|uniref:Response regulator rcp1 n=1 Tax=Aureliella helgolandensis TaxID=2527968 RepID=A0A518G6B6_9BACT|nr:response regulator [Aureliella helgolandensis]QDV24136.1 Response regulator rcp1 [Aureliella helgolandensis]